MSDRLQEIRARWWRYQDDVAASGAEAAYGGSVLNDMAFLLREISNLTADDECEERLAITREDVESLRDELRKTNEFIAAIEILSKDMNGEA